MSKIVGLFPGQGSQSVGMAKYLFDNFKLAKQMFEEASDAVSLDFKKLCFEGPESELQLTENTQPAIVLSSAVTHKVLTSEKDIQFSAFAGHSVGEYSAFVAAGVFDLAVAIKAVRLRGQSMQAAVPVGVGGMVALLGPSDEQAVELCKWVESENPEFVLEAANFNCPGQVVLSGHAKALTWLKENLAKFEFDPRPKKVRMIPLKVSAPFHCKLMKPAEEKMADFFDSIEFKKPSFPVYQNFTAKAVTETGELKTNLTAQVSGSVLWSKSVLSLKEEGFSSFCELGSGQTLSGLSKKIDSELGQLLNTSTFESFKELMAAL